MSASMYAILLAKSTKARLHAIYVVNTKALGDLVNAHIFVNAEKAEYLADLEKDAERHLKHITRLSASKDYDVKVVKAEGSPTAEVGRYIKENGIDLLVLGSVNMIRSRREELTSETDRMLRTVSCPVLVTRDDDSIWQMFEEE